MKTKDQIATKQERILQEKERELAGLQKEKGDLSMKLEKSTETHQRLVEQHNEAKELLKKNEALINYLNHKLTELQNLQPQQARLMNGNMTLDSSSSTNHQFRPSSFLVFGFCLCHEMFSVHSFRAIRKRMVTRILFDMFNNLAVFKLIMSQ